MHLLSHCSVLCRGNDRVIYLLYRTVKNRTVYFFVLKKENADNNNQYPYLR